MMQPLPARRPGELYFNLFLFLVSLFLFWSAYGISGFEALSSPGAVPMATTAVMIYSSAMVLWEVLKKPTETTETLTGNIIPQSVVVTIVMIALYALLLRPLGFIPTSILFLIVMIRYLSRRSIGFCIAVSVGTVALIYLIFRLIFTVLMPPGIVPEGEIIAWFGNLF